MDPLSVSAGVIGIVAVALHSTRRVIEFIDGIQGGPEAVKALSRDLSALENVLQTLNSVIIHPDFQANARRSELAVLLQDPLNNCTLALEEISLVIRPYIKTSGDAKTSKWRSFRWSFREKEISTLQKMLGSYKTSLTMAVAVANLSTTSTGFSEWSRQMESLQQQLNDDSMSIANSSFLGSEAIGSDPGFALRRFLRESDSATETGASSLPLLQTSFDLVVAVDFGMTATAVAYSAEPDWDSIETIQHWPNETGFGLADKVNTAISYDIRTDQIAAWGFLVDPDKPNTRLEENFKLYLDPGFRDGFHDAPTLEEARRWFTDFLACVYKSITRYFNETIPRWHARAVEFVFSIPTTWKTPAMIAEIEQLIRNAGFGKENKHTVEISLTEAEATAVYVAKQHFKKGDVFLVCDAGSRSTDINILRVSESNIGQTELEPLSYVEGAPIGLTLIDFRVEKLITQRLETIRHQLSAEPRKIAEKMMRTRFDTFKRNLGSEAMNVLKLPMYVTDLPPGLDFAQAYIEDSRMIITSDELKRIFDEQIERIFNLIDEELRKLQVTHSRENVSYLVLSGDLGSSPYVQKRLRNRYEMGTGNYPNAPNLKILKAPKPQLAVVHGLVMERVDRIKMRLL